MIHEILRLADHFESQACGWKKAAKFEAAENEEPVNSSLDRYARDLLIASQHLRDYAQLLKE